MGRWMRGHGLAAAALVSLLSACGGGSGDDSSDEQEQYEAGTHAVGQTLTFAVTVTRNSGQVSKYEETQEVTSVASSGEYTWIASSTASANGTTYVHDSDGNRLSQTADGGATCTYTPTRLLYSFPLYVGKTWTGQWDYDCGEYHEATEAEGTVEAMETITVGAGTFETLRIRSSWITTDSNDALLVGGDTGDATFQREWVCWWAPSIKRSVKCQYDYTYTGEAPANYNKSYVQELQEYEL